MLSDERVVQLRGALMVCVRSTRVRIPSEAHFFFAFYLFTMPSLTGPKTIAISPPSIVKKLSNRKKKLIEPDPWLSPHAWSWLKLGYPGVEFWDFGFPIRFGPGYLEARVGLADQINSWLWVARTTLTTDSEHSQYLGSGVLPGMFGYLCAQIRILPGFYGSVSPQIPGRTWSLCRFRIWCQNRVVAGEGGGGFRDHSKLIFAWHSVFRKFLIPLPFGHFLGRQNVHS